MTLRVRITPPSLNYTLFSRAQRYALRLCADYQLCCFAVSKPVSLVLRAPNEHCNIVVVKLKQNSRMEKKPQARCYYMHFYIRFLNFNVIYGPLDKWIT